MPAVGRLRHATADDFRRYSGCWLPAEWCVDGWVCGEAIERDGNVLAYGFLTQDVHGRIWGWFSRMVPVSPFLMHRKARHMLGILRRAGVPAIYAICSSEVAGAETWLRRLGFEPTETEVEGERVWLCNLT